MNARLLSYLFEIARFQMRLTAWEQDYGDGAGGQSFLSIKFSLYPLFGNNLRVLISHFRVNSALYIRVHVAV